MIEYEKLTLPDLEQRAKTLRQDSRQAQKEMYHILQIIRRYSRFKENPKYAKSSFWVYLEDQFMIQKRTYEAVVIAYEKYPNESLEFGPGLVSKILKECGGITKAKKVFAELRTKSASHKKPLSRAKIEEILQEFRSPIEKIKKEITDWRLMYETERIAHDKTRNELQQMCNAVLEQEKQIVKLKRTIERSKSGNSYIANISVKNAAEFASG
jgi:hypothetical protein